MWVSGQRSCRVDRRTGTRLVRIFQTAAPRRASVTAMLNKILGAAALALVPATAHAFCGFYVSGSGQKMTNDATQVVLMRDGTRTVLSMQNDYKGPLEDFAMVIPVPVVLSPTRGSGTARRGHSALFPAHLPGSNILWPSTRTAVSPCFMADSPIS